MDLQKLIGDIATHMHAETWIVQVFVVVFATLLLDWSQKRIVQRIHSGLQKTRTVWDDALVDALATAELFLAQAAHIASDRPLSLRKLLRWSAR